MDERLNFIARLLDGEKLGRTVLRNILRSRAISLIDFPLVKCSRRIPPIVSTTSIPTARSNLKQAAQQIRTQGVNFRRRSRLRGQNCTPKHTPASEPGLFCWQLSRDLASLARLGNLFSMDALLKYDPHNQAAHVARRLGG
jgi:hypothetical protein